MKKPYTAPALKRLGLVRVKNQHSACATPDAHRDIAARTPTSDTGIVYAQPTDNCTVD